MPLVSADIPKSLRIALDQEIARLRTDESGVVTAALSKYLGVPVHTLFQVSTSGALVAGVYDRAVTVKSILELGDFGLGTFADLDGRFKRVRTRAVNPPQPGTRLVGRHQGTERIQFSPISTAPWSACGLQGSRARSAYRDITSTSFQRAGLQLLFASPAHV